MTEKIICDALHMRYYGTDQYKLSNSFIFNWESDFFIQKQNNYSYEIEVKITRSDFFADIKKTEKHAVLRLETSEQWRPNKFFYCCPEGLILAHEVPEYAGLMYYSKLRGVWTVKEAPFIHKIKYNFSDKLCTKFYYYWHNEKNKNFQLQQDFNKLKEKYDNLNNSANKLLSSNQD